jgi:hypothetical protein
VLVGRRFDLAHLRTTLDAVAEGRGRAVVLVGRPGVGKTALLDQVPALAPTAEVVRATGVESEADLAWAGLATLLERLVDGTGWPRWPRPGRPPSAGCCCSTTPTGRSTCGPSPSAPSTW